jgi:hypothetical protein
VTAINRDGFYKENDMAVVQLGEIKAGLVLHLSHEELERRGYRIPQQRPDRFGHMFLCLEAGEKDSTWVMLTSRGRFGRPQIQAEAKEGHQTWIERPTFVSGRETMLHAKNWDIQESSANEPSRERRRNWVSDNVVQEIRARLLPLSIWG